MGKNILLSQVFGSVWAVIKVFHLDDGTWAKKHYHPVRLCLMSFTVLYAPPFYSFNTLLNRDARRALLLIAFGEIAFS